MNAIGCSSLVLLELSKKSTLLSFTRYPVKSIILALSFLIGVVPFAQATILSGPIKYNGHTYYLLDEANWTDSEAEAITLGGHLATVNDSFEDSWIYSTFSNFGGEDRNLWIGLYDADQSNNADPNEAGVLNRNRAARRAEFRWISGEPVTYTNWSPFEPNSQFSSEPNPWEFYGHIWEPGDPWARTWNNYVDSASLFGNPMNGVVEVVAPQVPEPSTVFLMGLGLSGLGFARRRRLNA